MFSGRQEVSRARLDWLATEVLWQILDDLREDTASLARLAVCCRNLKDVVQDYLWALPGALRRAMYWGCRHGGCDVILRAISLGASPSLLQGIETTLPKETLDAGVQGVLTLHLALRHSQLQAFTLLLDHGAVLNPKPKLHPKLHAEQLRLVVDRIVRKSERSPAFLRMYLERGLGEQIRDSGCHGQSGRLSLLDLVAFKSPHDILRVFLDRNPGLVDYMSSAYGGLRHRSSEQMTPLSTAILAGSPETAEMLIRHGADVNVDSAKLSPSRRAMHIPIFAAACSMATSESGPDMLKLCLKHGANINQTAECTALLFNPRRKVPRYLSRDIYMATPLHAFLGCIDFHLKTSGLDPRHALVELLEAGADIKVMAVEKHSTNREPMSTLRLLMQMWPRKWLTDETFREFTRLLIQHDGVQDATEVLVEFATACRHNHYSVDPAEIEGQHILVDLLVEHWRVGSTVAEISQILAKYIRRECHYGRQCECGIAFELIRKLVGIGADPNKATMLAPWSTREQNVLMPIIHEVCYYIRSASPQHYGTQWTFAHAGWRKRLLVLLCELGADPGLEIEHTSAVGMFWNENLYTFDYTPGFKEMLEAEMESLSQALALYMPDGYVPHRFGVQVGEKDAASDASDQLAGFRLD